MKHIYIPPSGLLGTHGLLTHDIAKTFDRNPRPKTLDFKTKQNKCDTSSLTDDLIQQSQEGNKDQLLHQFYGMPNGMQN